MSEKRDYSLCIDCKYQDGTWVSDREVDTWCTIKSGIDCDETFECDDYEAEVVDDEVEMLEKINVQQARIKELEEEKTELLKKVFLFEKGIAIYLQKEEQMNLYTYVDLEMKRWRFDNE